MFREHNVTRNSIKEISRNYSTNSSDSFSTKTTHLVEKPDKKAGPLKEQAGVSLSQGHYQMTTLSSSGRNISPSVMPKAS